jgi:hypothetical protein
MAEKLLGFVSPSDVDAVIFFSDQDELSVLTRNGMVDPFLTSPFAGSQLDRCFVYLDQSHTRGTDLKLPDNYRAAVTLGPGVTKDTLVQVRQMRVVNCLFQAFSAVGPAPKTVSYARITPDTPTRK